MATRSSLTAPWKGMTAFQGRGNVSFLDMSLDDIILLKNSGDGSTEEKKGKFEDDMKKPGTSGEQSDAHEHPWQRGHAKHSKERSDNDSESKSGQEDSVSKSGQSPLNQQPLQKQEKCNDDYKAQLEEKEQQSEGNRDNLERSHDQPKRFHGQSERSHGPSGRSHGHSEKSHGHSERSHGHSERSHGRPERSHGRSEKSHGHSERFHGHSGRSHGHSGRSYGQSERSHCQSERYGRYFPGRRFKTSFKSDSQFDGHFTIKKGNDFFYKRMPQRNDPMDMNREITLEDEYNSYETKRSYTRYVSHGEKILFLKNRNVGEDSLYQPKGVYLKFNYQALGNKTKLSLNDRFSKLEAMRKPRVFLNN
ncbi:leucine zipper protein 4 [Heterocephalus glaber]|uniref:Leucine zipper protein 4 n=1 Tax=Heterocephalus glaber TaxID=10181 RepID=A0AAX6SG72_HETGA|nr:leucine zipper protein 4 [Heterocephalus glaber]